jgi:phosphopantetheinyl transferase
MAARIHLLSWRDALGVDLSPLSTEEKLVYERLTVPKRKRDWLLGRLSAKSAIGDVFNVPPHAIQVVSVEGEGPGFLVRGEKQEAWHLSLSHGHGLAVALLAQQAVGVDLEKLRPLEPAAWRFFLSETEQAWLKGDPLGPYGAIVAWALKEAAFKALRGAAEALAQIQLLEAHQGVARLGCGAVELSARYAQQGDFVLAVATVGPAPLWLSDLPLAPLFNQEPV